MKRSLSSGLNAVPKVAVLVNVSHSVCREMLRGISRYARIHGPWSLHLVEGDYMRIAPQMEKWGCNGIVAHFPHKCIDETVIDTALPTVAICLSDEQRHPANPLSKLSDVSFDAADQVAELAAEHFLQRNIRSFAYVGLEEVAWSKRRELAFSARISDAGFATNIYRQPPRQRDGDWQPEQAILTEWLRGLPKPVGILACNDDRGRKVLESCRLIGLQIPERVAVLGVDNDATFCDMADPPLSSVALDAEAAGYEVAELLDGLMRGRVRKSRRVFVKAVGIVTRRSTETVAVDDCDVVAALKYIHREPLEHISVNDVVQAVATSRRALEKRFRVVLGRTILQEIQRTRLERALRLLVETDYPIAKIAELSGFGTTNWFIQFFQQRVGRTPSEFRGSRAS